MIRRRASQSYHGASGQPLAGGGWELRIGRLLSSPNRNPSAHWATHHADRTAWETAVRDALIVAADVRKWSAYQQLVKPERVKRRMHVTIVREVPSKRNFIKDRDNLLFSTKKLRDSLKSLGLIYDDSIRWLEMPDPEQRVSDDGLAWTVIRIQPVEGA
jgi:hypothetical protein